MGNISFTQGIYNPSDSFLHKLDPRSKIIGSLMLIISVLSGSFFSFESSFKVLIFFNFCIPFCGNDYIKNKFYRNYKKNKNILKHGIYPDDF